MGNKATNLDATMNDADLYALKNANERENDEKKGRGKAKTYKLIDSFINTKDAVDFILKFENARWKHKDDSSNKKYENLANFYFMKTLCVIVNVNSRRYYCRDCKKAIYLAYNEEGEGVHLFAEDVQHEHDQERPKNLLPLESVNRAKELFENYSNQAIIRKLREENLPQLTNQQLRNLKTRYNKQKYGPATTNLHSLQKWCEERKATPKDKDQPYVLASYFEHRGNSITNLSIIITTERLLQLPLKRKDLLVCDATYKVI